MAEMPRKSYGCKETDDTPLEVIQQNLQEQSDEILALKSIFPDTDRVQLLNEPVTRDNLETTSEDLYSLQLSAVVHVESDGITVEAWLPHDGANHTGDDDVGENAAANPAPNFNKPQYQRSASGHRWYSSFRVHHLTPVCLELVLPKSYPSDCPPRLSLSCLWLDRRQLSMLCKELDKLWREARGMPVMYIWMDWLQTNTLSTLGLDSTICLVPPVADVEDQDLLDSLDPRTLSEQVTLDESLAKMHRFNYEEKNRMFSQSQQICGICFEVKFGHEFFRLSECQHHFCADCMAAYCQLHVKEGTIQQLMCPNPKCTTSLPTGVLQAVLGDQDYERWERLVLQNTLDMMGDVVWCPRCNNPVVRDKEVALQLAHCTTCLYAFCSKCRESWHQQRPCADDEEIDDETPQTRENKLRKTKQEVVNNKMSTRWVRQFTKPCPKCASPIEKNGGCNKVTCMRCYAGICWICGKELSGYDHFGQCPLWSDEFTVPRHVARPVPEGAIRVQEHLREHRDEGRKHLSPCPNCHQNNLKENRNNHIRCYACRKNYCFMCNKIVNPPIMMHYKVGSSCVQHSD